MNPKKVRFYSSMFQEHGKKYKAGDIVEIQIMRSGKWSHAQYGNVVVTDKIINEVMENFNSNERGIDLAIDENHEPNHKALAWMKELFTKTKDSLFAKAELTKKGAESLTNGEYKYFSPEIIFGPMKDSETGKKVSNLLTGGAFTNRPFFKKMSPLMANEDATNEQQDGEKLFLSIIDDSIMKKFNELLEAAKAKKILSFDEKFALKCAFNELDEDERTETVETEVAEQTDKPETEVEAPAKKEGEGAEGESKPAEAKAATEIKASERTVTAAQYTEMVAKVATLEAENAKNTVEKEFNESFVFNDSNKKGVLKIKHKDSFVAFAMTLNADQKKSFYEILGSADSTMSQKFEEMGVNHNDNSNVVNDAGQKYNEAVEKIMEAKNIDYSDACDVLNAQQN